MVNKILILSDIHSNYPALKSVLAEEGSYDSIINVGDLVGYNAYPNEVVEWMSSNKDKIRTTIGGNHDYAVLNDNTAGFNTEHGINAIKITQSLLTEDNMSKLSELSNSFSALHEGLEVLHCEVNTDDGVNYSYINIYPDTFDSSTYEGDVVIVGHSHLQFKEVIDDTLLINPGSVGQSRTGESKAFYAVMYYEEGKSAEELISDVELKSVEYDIDEVADANQSAGFDIFISQRLYLGI